MSGFPPLDFPGKPSRPTGGNRLRKGIGTFPGKLDGLGFVSPGKPTGARGRGSREKRTQTPATAPRRANPRAERTGPEIPAKRPKKHAQWVRNPPLIGPKNAPDGPENRRNEPGNRPKRTREPAERTREPR